MIPAQGNQIAQPNDGERKGNMFASFNVDASSNPGKIGASYGVLKAVDENDDADFDSYAAAFGVADGDIYAASNEIFNNTSIFTPATGWAERSGLEVSAALRDATHFDGNFLVSAGDDIRSYASATNVSWWQGTLSQSALSSLRRVMLRRGPDQNLYVVDGGNKVYRVATDETVTKTGAGTLDYSATDYTFTCMEPNSTRLWIGTENTNEGEAVILEWDMGASTISPNREHPIGANAVRCIAIWNDTPIAILSSGEIKYFDGNSFVDWPGARFGNKLAKLQFGDDFIHPNGWAIIDDKPHFLVKGVAKTDTGGYTDDTAMPYYIASGVWCLDPEIGLYHRFALGTGLASQYDYGQLSLKKVGALFANENYKTKFYASYEYWLTPTTSKSMVAYHDIDGTQPSRSWFVTRLPLNPDVPQSIQCKYKNLSSGDEIRLYYRQANDVSQTLDGAWASDHEFNSAESTSGISAGEIGIVKAGAGAGAVMRISAMDTSAGTTQFTFDESNPFVTQYDAGTIEFVNFKLAGKITNTGKDYETFSIPSTTRSREVEVLVEMRRTANSKMEIDNVDII